MCFDGWMFLHHHHVYPLCSAISAAVNRNANWPTAELTMTIIPTKKPHIHWNNLLYHGQAQLDQPPLLMWSISPSQIMPPCISMMVFLTLDGLYCNVIVSVCLSWTWFVHPCVYSAVRSAVGTGSFQSSNRSYFFFPLLAIVVAMWSVVSCVHIQDYCFWCISCILTSFFLTSDYIIVLCLKPRRFYFCFYLDWFFSLLTNIALLGGNNIAAVATLHFIMISWWWSWCTFS